MNKIIFDFDGPIGDTWELLIEYTALKKGMSYKEAKEDQLKYFMTPKHSNQIVLTEIEKINKNEFLDGFVEFIKSKYNKEKAIVPIFEEFINNIRKLNQKEFGIISSGTINYILPSICQYLDLFPFIQTFENHQSKINKIEELKKYFNYDDNVNLIYITDTLSDVIELENYLGLDNIYGVIWGVHEESILKQKLKSSKILRNYEDILKIPTF
jgi:phosphoglycolate phosphatase-like HAD superfamily hydrolase